MNDPKRYSINKSILRFEGIEEDLNLNAVNQGRTVYHILKMNYEVPEIAKTVFLFRKDSLIISMSNRTLRVSNWTGFKKFKLNEEQTKALYEKMEKYYKSKKFSNDDFYWVSRNPGKKIYSTIRKYYTELGELKTVTVKS
jgi:hypothetical protein